MYQEEIRDLLHKDQTKRLELKERPDTGIYVKVSIHSPSFETTRTFTFR